MKDKKFVGQGQSSRCVEDRMWMEAVTACNKKGQVFVLRRGRIP